MIRASDPAAGGPEGAGGAEQGGAGGDIYTMIEAARLKGVSYHTVSRAVRRGKLPAQRLGRMALITAEDLRAWRPMRERAPRKYRRREPNPDAAPALLDLASGQRVDLARQLSTFYELLHSAATELPLADFLALVCDRLGSALDFRRVAIWGTYPGDPRAIRLAMFGPRFRELPAEIILAEAPAFAALMERDEAGVTPEVTGLPGGGGRGPAITSLFVVPLRVGGDRVGVIVADRGGEPFTLSQDQLWLAQAMANQAALVMEQARLRAAESERADELAAILETLSEAVFACDASGRMTVCNAAGRELLGIEAGSLSDTGDARAILGRQERQTLDGRPLPVNETPLIRALGGKAVHAARYRLIDATTGEPRVVSESAVPILRDGRVAGAVAVARIVPDDMSGGESSGSGPPTGVSGTAGGASTDAPQAALERAKDEFLSVLAHEIRNPLTSLRGNLQLLQRHIRQDPSRAADLERVDSVLRQTDRMTMLVNRLFDASRAELDRFDLSLAPADAVVLARHAVESAGGLLAREGVVVDAPEAMPVLWDEERVEQVLANLLNNAAKYAPTGGIEVSIRLVAGDRIEIAVRDHGPGVPEARQARIFERYYRLRDDAAPREGSEPEGLGLGLYISRQLALAHGGDLTVENAEGGGARFVVLLPRDASPFIVPLD